MRDRQAPKLKGRMRKAVFALMLALTVGCASPDRFRDLRTRDPVTTRRPPWVIESIAEFLTFVGQVLGPQSGKVIY